LQSAKRICWQRTPQYQSCQKVDRVNAASHSRQKIDKRRINKKKYLGGGLGKDY